MPAVASPLADRLAAARRGAGLSREQAALAIGRSWSSLAGYERGVNTPPVPVLVDLAALYGTTVSALLAEGVERVA